MTIVVHHLNNSRSQRVLWLLEELGLDYEIKHYQRGADRRAPKELFEVHPLGRSPVITDGDKTIAESGAIIDYIITKYGDGRAITTSEADKLDDIFWSHFAEGSFMPTAVMKLIFSIVPSQSPFFVRPIVGSVMGALQKQFTDPDLERKIKYTADAIEKRDPSGKAWFAGGDKDGNPTAADYQMLFCLEASINGGRVSTAPQSLKNWVAHVHERPAYKKALEKGGPYAYGPTSKL